MSFRYVQCHWTCASYVYFRPGFPLRKGLFFGDDVQDEPVLIVLGHVGSCDDFTVSANIKWWRDHRSAQFIWSGFVQIRGSYVILCSSVLGQVRIVGQNLSDEFVNGSQWFDTCCDVRQEKMLTSEKNKITTIKSFRWLFLSTCKIFGLFKLRRIVVVIQNGDSNVCDARISF